MRRSVLIASLLLPLALPISIATGALAQTPAADAQPAAPELRTTAQVVDQVCNFLKTQRSFTVEMDITYDDVLDFGNKVQYSAYQTLSVQKPNRLRSEYVGDERVTNFYYDGRTVTLYAPNFEYYATKAAPATLDAALAQVEDRYGITIPMSNLVASDPCANLKADVQDMIFVGVNMVDREPTYQILMLGSDRDYQIWVTQDPQPLLRKAIITYKELPGEPQYTVYFSNWNFRPSLPASTFTFTPPDAAVAIEMLPIEPLPAVGTHQTP